MIKPSADIYTRFFTYNSSGALTDDDGTPAGVLVKNGTDTVETVTVTKLTTGSYKAAFTIPSDAVTGDMFELQITVTMSTVVQKDIIWRDIVDTYANSDVVTELRNTSGFEKIVPKTMLIPTADSNIYFLVAIADSPDNSEIGISLLNGNNAILYEDDALTTPLSASVTFENYMVMPSLNANIYMCYVKVDHTETAKQYNYVFIYAKNSVEYYHTAETSLIDEDVVVKSLSTDVITADSIKTDAITEIQNGLATGVDLATVDGIVDAIKLKTDGLNFTGTDVKATLDGETVAVSSIGNNVITAASINSDAVTELQAGLATSVDLGTVDTVVDAIKAKTDNLPADPASNTQVNTRMATFTYTAPDNVSIGSIKTKTDQLTFLSGDVVATLNGETVTASSVTDKTGYALTVAYDSAKTAATQTSVDTIDGIVNAIKSKTDTIPADPATNTQVNTRMASFTYTAPDNASITAIKAKTDNLSFTGTDVKATLDGETVTAATVSDKTGYALTAAYDAAKTAATQTSVNTVDGIVDSIKAKTDNLPADPASNTVVNTRLATVGYTAPDNASITAIKAKTDNLSFTGTDVKATLDGEAVTATSVSDKTGYSLTSAYDAAKSAASQTSVDTVDGVVDAIKAKTDNLPADPASNTQVATRLASSAYTAPDNASVTAIKAKTDQLSFSSGDVIATLNGETVTASSVTDKTGYSLANDSITSSTLATAAITEIQSGLATSSALSTVDTVVDAIKAKTDNLPSDPASNTVVNTRLAATSYTAPDNSSIADIKERTALIPDDPATETSLSGIEDKIDTLQSSVETGNSDTPTVEEIVEGILSAAIDGEITVQEATRRILSTSANKVVVENNDEDLYKTFNFYDTTGENIIVEQRVYKDGSGREIV